jgi:flagellar biosynthesis anti-sigma factor FlgM
MEIPEKGPLPIPSTRNKSAQTQPSSTAETTGRRPEATPGDSIRLTERGSRFVAAVKHVQQLPEIREDRVTRLKRQLEEGTYRVQGQRIAANLITETVENNNVLEHIDDDA